MMALPRVAMYAGWLASTAIAASRPEPTGSLPLAGRLLILVGEADLMVPASDIAALRAWQPAAQVITYPPRRAPLLLRRPPGL